jgi:hypothetical protein
LSVHLGGPFGKSEIRVAGQVVKVDVTDLKIGNVDSDMAQVSAQMAWFGAVYAAAKEQEIVLDSNYRHWRANKAAAILKSEDKLAEWKVKNLIEGDKTFLELKALIAAAAKDTEAAKVMYESFRVKASLLQSKGANMRAEIAIPTASRGPKSSEPDPEVYESVEEENDEDDSVEQVAQALVDSTQKNHEQQLADLKARNIFKNKKKGKT